MSSDDEIVVLTGGGRGNIPGSRRYNCTQCGKKIWLAPSGQSLMAAKPDILLLCMACSRQAAAREPDVKYGVTRAALREFDAWKKRN